MARELIENVDNDVTYVPRMRARPSSATLSFKTPGGTELSTPSVTVDSIGSGGTATVDTVTSQTEIDVDDATGIQAGHAYWLSAQDGWGAQVRVGEIDGTTLYLESPPPGTVEANDTLHGFELRATISSGDVATRDLFYRLDWTITDTDGTDHYEREMAHVVAMRFASPVTPAEAMRYMSQAHPGEADSWIWGQFRELAERASERVRQRLVQAGNRPHRMGDQSALKPAGIVAFRIELAERSVVPPGYEPDAYLQAQERALDKRMREALANAPIDRDDDQAFEASEIRPLQTIRIGRA